MAVPNTAYKGTVTINKAANTPVVHRAGVMHTNNATHKNLFYLDDMLAVKDAWIGCTYPGSVNHEMHAANRRGSGRKGSAVWLNDQFQTKGFANTIGGGSTFWKTLFANYVRADLLYRSAYYIDTSNFGFEYRLAGATLWNSVTLEGGRIPQQVSVSKIQRLPAHFNPLTTYQVRFFIQNSEGIYHTDIAPMTTEDNIIEELFNVRTASCTATGNNIKLFIKSDDRARMSNLTLVPQDLNIRAYASDSFTAQPAQGWYFTFDDGYSYYYNSTLGFTHRQECSIVPTIKIQIIITVFESGYWTATASNITGASFSTAITFGGNVTGRNTGGGVVSSFPFGVTIPANQTSGNNTGNHQADFVSQLNWEAGGFTSSNASLVAANQIKATVGIGN